MICNPVVIKSSGSQTYRIIDNTSTMGFPENAEAGEIVKGHSFGVFVKPPIVMDASGVTIPHGDTLFGKEYRGYFVMPASDVTISST